MTLPLPRKKRWQPLRGGLVNLYRYDDEQFWYEDGHLLLRGNNGTGKSRVLALQLPFLLDGEVTPHRMEPDADPSKRVEWNLLMGRHADRQGYTWLELGRCVSDATDGAEFLTIGCGLAAVEGRPLVSKWFFMTKRRVGRDLFLVSSAGVALGREKLAEALQGDGEVFTTATAYRQAIDDRLFRLGRQRYEALLGLLIQLRQPQLSRHLDEERLSTALSEALGPPPAQMVADVAEAFRGLEADRLLLDGFRQAGAAVDQFLREYRRYTQIASRRRAQVLRSAHSSYEATLRRLRECERARSDADSAAAAATAALAEARVVVDTAEATVQALRDSPAMQDAQTLRRVREQTDEAARRAEDARREQARRQDAAERCERDHFRSTAEAGTSAEVILARLAKLGQAAARIGVAARHEAAVAPLALAEPQGTGPLRAVSAALAALVDDRKRAGTFLEELGVKLTRAQVVVEHAQSSVDERRGRADEALEAQAAASAALEAAEEELLANYRAWDAGLRELVAEDIDDIGPAVADWCRQPTGRSPVAVAAARAGEVAREDLSRARVVEESRGDGLAARLAELEADRARWQAGEHQPPAAPQTRDLAWRQEAAGAPLWRLCEFVEGVDAGIEAGVEAALEASGLLDAWVTPDGRLLDVGEHDALLTTSIPVVVGPRLGTILRPAVDRDDGRMAAVTDELVAALLDRIGFGPSDAVAWVDADGRFRLGPLEGRWNKPAAQHIGEGARDADRRRRLEELSRTIASIESELSDCRAAIDLLVRRTQLATDEQAAAPDDHPVRLVAARLDAVAREIADARERLVEAEARLVEVKRQLHDRSDERDTAAADLGLAGWVEDLRGLTEAIGEYRAQVGALEPALMAHQAARRAAEAAVIAVTAALAEKTRATEAYEDARTRHARFAAELAVLDASIGAEVEEILGRLRLAQEEVESARKSVKARDQEDRAALEARVRATAEVEASSAERVGREEERDTAIGSLARFAATGLLAVAAPEVSVEEIDSSPTRAVEVARAVEETLVRVEAGDAAWDRSTKGLLDHVQSAEQALISHGYQPSATMEDGVIVVRVPFQGRPHTMAEFGRVLAGEISERQLLLGAREREVIENHLVGEVSLHLHELLHAGERWVSAMNRELEDRPTSTGMTLRFAWTPLDEGPEDRALGETRKRLMRAGGTWSPRDRDAIGAFLQQRIQAVRAARPAGTWQDHLAEALDYRRWHRFAVERQQDGVWRRLTRRTHGTGSGGEKAIALTIPQFAAAAAHYRSADPLAPRLIMLDEAFVGVDSDMRSKCMGLLATFDLDFVMTSEREWGCYPTLPGLAIYQLATRPGIDAVGVTRFVWNGRERLRADASPTSARARDEEAAPAP